MKKVLLLLALVSISFIANAQIKNTFIQQGKFVLYPEIEISKNTNNVRGYRFGMELAYMPFNRFEIRPGVVLALDSRNYVSASFGSRYYLLKSKFTLFPEINTSMFYTEADKKINYYYDYAFGMGYYGILKRIGVDVIMHYYPHENLFAPRFKLKILLGKIEE